MYRERICLKREALDSYDCLDLFVYFVYHLKFGTSATTSGTMIIVIERKNINNLLKTIKN